MNAARTSGRRVVAVGTTAVRALETVTDESGTTHPGEGWTRLIVTPERGIRLWTRCSRACTSPAPPTWPCSKRSPAAHLRAAYGEALREGYLWHEFGDLHLIL